MKDDSISLVHAAVMAMVSSPDFVAELQKRIHAVVPQKQATNTGSPKLFDDMESFAVACARAGNGSDARKVRLWVKQLRAGAT